MKKRFGNKDFLVVMSLVLVLGAGTIGAAVYLKLMAPEDDGAYVPRETPITPEIELLQEYVRIPTTPGNEEPGARFLLKILEESGVGADLIETSPGRFAVHARVDGRRDGEGLLLLHHIDVVPVDESSWTHPPWAAEIHLNMMWGRGTLDMKGIGICQLLAFLDVARSRRVPERDLVFLAVPDEERGSIHGMRALVRDRPELFEGIRFALNEGGITEVIREKIHYFAIETGSKQFVKVELSSPDRKTLEAAVERLRPWAESREPDGITPAVKEYFRTIAPFRTEWKDELSDIDEAIRSGSFYELPRAYTLLTQNGLQLQEIRQSDGRWRIYALLHVVPGEDPNVQVRRVVDQVADLDVDVQWIDATADGPVGVSSMRTELFERMTSHVKDHYGEDVGVGPYLIAVGSTDCRFLRPRGIDCYGLWPFPVDYFQSQGIHRSDERIRLDWFLEGVELTRELVEGYIHSE